ncbi:MAG: hypothetical protein AAGJ37_07985 [Pseudomonadota bacterium]
MSKSKLVKVALVFSLITLVFLKPSTLFARETTFNRSVTISQTLAAGIDNNNSDLIRFSLRPTLDAKMPSGWRAKAVLRLERSDGDTGLGTLDTFDSISKPWDINAHTHLELERATLSWRKRSTRITLGKQTLAWGVLDGLQVTDRFDATRKREAVFIDQRPDRIARWGARAQFKSSNIRWDIGLLLDGTGDQLATIGSTYAVRAARFRAGLDSGQTLPAISIHPSNEATFGIRGNYRWGKSDMSLLMIQGPDPEPVYSLNENGIDVRFEARTLLGLTWQHPHGPRVWRLEVASIHNQPINTQQNGLTIVDRNRWLAGVGLDWDLPKNTFLNIQIGLDDISGEQLFRTNRDVISTIKIQRGVWNNTLKLSTEFIGSLRENDGTVRPAIGWHASDSLYLQAGVDIVWGNMNETFGQFNETDRVWLRAAWEL